MTPREELLGVLARWDPTLFTLGNSSVRVSTVLAIVAALVLLFSGSLWLRNWLVRRLARHTQLTPSSQEVIGNLVRYAVLVFGFLALLQTLGLNLSTFSMVAGALGVGIGFGLQNIFSNFISGLIIMLERPVKIGDRIEIAGVEGDVIAIGARSTRLRTARQATVIVPNQKFITDNVRNWDVGGSTTALLLTAKLARDHDPREGERLLMEIAREQPRLLDSPAPTVYLTAMDGAAFTFELEAWMMGSARERAQVLSAMYFALYEKAKAASLRLM